MSKEIFKYLLAITGVILGWVMVTPAFEFPDEQAHLGSVEYLARQGEMPRDGKLDLTTEMAESQKLLGIYRNELGQNSYTYHPEYRLKYSDNLVGPSESAIKDLNTETARTTYIGSEAAKYPPLYYHVIRIVSRWAIELDLLARLYASRLAGILLVPIMAYFVYHSGLLIFNSRAYARTLTLLVMLQPMFSFVSSGVNSDNLHNLWFFVLTYISLRLIKHGIKLGDLVGLGAVIALDIATKPQGFIAVVLAGLALLIAIIRFRQWRMLLAIVVIAIASVVLGGTQWDKYKHLLNVANQSGATFIEYLRFTANKLVAQNVVWYWGVFKWLGVVLPPIYWRIANRVVLLSVVGLVIYLWRIIKRKKVISDPFTTLYLLLASTVYALVIFWYDWQHTKINGYSLGIQARYFFPTIIAHMAILLTGILSLGWSKLTRRCLRFMLVALFVWLQLGGLYRLVSSYYELSSLQSFITQVSQYKPEFAKGEWWYLWISIYLISLACVIYHNLRTKRVA